MAERPRDGFRAVVETYSGFTWNEVNRDRHFAKHGIDFPLVTRANWTRVLKRVDSRHRGDPPRWNALVGFADLDLVLFVVYIKRHGNIHIISARRATFEERAVFLLED